MDEKDLEKKLEELKSKIEAKEKELDTLWCCFICVTIIVSIISFNMLVEFIVSLKNLF